MKVPKHSKQADPAAKTDRRSFMKHLCTAGGIAVAPSLISTRRTEWGEASRSSVFTLGVASGDPTDDSVVLWTRLAPDPLNGGGMSRHPIDVRWEVAIDPAMRHIVESGFTTAHPRDGHAVSVQVDGLRSNKWYYYRFSAVGEHSRVGRTRTFPSPDVMAHEMRFALVSCQNFQDGYFAAYRAIQSQPLDFVVHVGDYIYEDAGNALVPVERRHNGGEISSVLDYRNRYALYRLDPHLQDAHAAFPFLMTWDDHEVDNNYAALIPEDAQTAEAFLERRSNAYQVYVETMPLRPRIQERRGTVNLYRSIRFGRLAEFFILDTRQNRTDQPCADGFQALQACPAILDPAAAMIGDVQESWLLRNLWNSRAVWNVIAQQVMMMRWDLGAIAGPGLNLFNVDAWDGYQAQRDRLMNFLADKRIENAVVLTGDIHSSWAADLKANFTNAASPIVGAEFVCSSITSTFGDSNDPLVRATIPSNPHIKFFDGLHRGYVSCTVTPNRWRADFRAVTRSTGSTFTVPSADLPVFDLASFGLVSGEPGLQRLA